MWIKFQLKYIFYQPHRASLHTYTHSGTRMQNVGHLTALWSFWWLQSSCNSEGTSLFGSHFTTWSHLPRSFLRLSTHVPNYLSEITTGLLNLVLEHASLISSGSALGTTDFQKKKKEWNSCQRASSFHKWMFTFGRPEANGSALLLKIFM